MGAPGMHQQEGRLISAETLDKASSAAGLISQINAGNQLEVMERAVAL